MVFNRIGLAGLVALCLALPLAALDVAESELASTGARPIEFINYEGPHAVIESAESIRGIGRSLGTAVARGAQRSGEIGRYSVIHAVDPSVKTGYDADIIILGEGARVDHIKNLRRIVAGYLEAAYAYSAKDADTLAVFITIYNAVYRGNIEYFKGKYKPVVMTELSPANAGLSLRWDEWAGRSRIVIPLSTRTGPGIVGSVATSPITDKPTIESLKAETPAGAVKERIEVVDIKERGQEEEQAAIKAERDRIAREEADIAAEKTHIDQEKAATGIAPGQMDPGRADPGSQQTEIAGTQTEAGAVLPAADDNAQKGRDQEASIEVSERARQEEAALAAREAQLAADKEAVAAREEAAKEKAAEIAEDRAAIAQDQKEAIKEEVAAQTAREAGGVPLFELVDPNLPFSRIALVDLASGKTIRKSELNTIRAATALDMGEAFVAVTGQVSGAGGAIRLARIDKADYSKVAYGSDDLFADTMLWKYGSSIYAVIKKGGGWAIGRFDPQNLQLKASSDLVSRWTFLSQAGGALVVQSPRGAFLLLDAEALSTAKELGR